MGTASNRELIEYFRSRRVWLLEPDGNPPRFSEYPGGAPTEAAGISEVLTRPR
jgi:hypothetical protein